MTSENLARPAETDRGFFVFNAVLSLGALTFLCYLLYVRQASPMGVDLRFLPSVNAALNACAATLLCAGYVAIRRGARRAHQYFMVAAFVASALFFICYVAYHYAHGDTKYVGTGTLRTVYFAVLISHIVLSVFVVPLAPTTLYFSLRGRMARHRTIARITLPIWLYVSVTGVVIYFMLRGSVPAVP